MTFCHKVFLRYMPTPWRDLEEVDREIVSELSKNSESRIKFMKWLTDLSEPLLNNFVCRHSLLSKKVVGLLNNEEKAAFQQTAKKVEAIAGWLERSSVFWELKEREALPPNWQLPAQEERIIAHLKENKKALKRIVEGLENAPLHFVSAYPKVAAHVLKVAPRDLEIAQWIMDGINGDTEKATVDVFLAYAACGFCDRVQQMVQQKGITQNVVEAALIGAINKDSSDEKQRRQTVYYLMSLLGNNQAIANKAFRKAVAVEDLELIDFFNKNYRIDVNEKDAEGTTVLMVAASSGAYISVGLLLDVYPVNPNAQDAQGRTALMHAILEPVFCLETFMRLVFRVDPQLKNAQGQTVFELLQHRIKDRDDYVDDLLRASWKLKKPF